MKKLRHLLEYAAVHSCYRLIRMLPHRGIALLSRLVGTGMWFFPPFRKLIRANIRAAMPEKTAVEIDTIGRKSCSNVLNNLLEFIWLTGIPERIRRCYVLPEEITNRLRAHVAAGERIIFVNPHLGSWEASGLMAPFYAGVEMVAIAKPVRNPYLNRFLNQGNREKEHGLRIIFAQGAIRAATRALREGLGVGTLIDQNTKIREGGEFVNFFGLPVPTSMAPAALKRYCDVHGIPAVIIYGSSLRMPDGTVRAHSEYLSKPFDQYPDEKAVVEELMAISEKYIRQYPDQYLWLYKRFLNMPRDLDPEKRARYPFYAKVASDSFLGKKEKH